MARRAFLAALCAAFAFCAAPNSWAEVSAIEALRDRADHGDPNALYELGVRYYEGKGVPQDRGEAAKWLRKAADRGNPQAQYRLGMMHASGDGVPQDNIEAHLWLNLAAARMEGTDRDNAVQNRFLVARRMTPAEIAEAERLAREWNPVGAGQ